MVNKKILLSLLTICFVGVAAAGTWAAYTTSAPTVATTATASTFGMSVGGWTPWVLTTPDQWAPGEEAETSVTITNTGNMPGYLFGDFSATAGSGEASAALLDSVLVSISGPNVDIVDVSASDDSLSEIDFGEVAKNPGEATITITLKIPEDAGTEVAGGSINPVINFKLNQNPSYINA